MISILMPVYNTESYLADCIESILIQTEQDWELIAVDDCSTDNSWEILKHYEQLDTRIRVFANTSKGLIEALKLAYAQARGEYISRMDSDDINVPFKYEFLLKNLKEHGRRHVAVGQVRYFTDGEIGDGFAQYERWLNELIASGQPFTDVYKECVIPSPCWMVHRDDFIACGGFSSSFYPEDYDLCFRFYKAGLKCIPSNSVLLHWRDHAARTSRTDEKYHEYNLLRLKCYYFLQIDYQVENELVLWGAGGRAKFIAKYLLEHKIPFQWICNNPKKIGKDIYEVKLREIALLEQLMKPQILVTVSNRKEQSEIVDQCKEMDWTYFLFC